MNRTYSQKQLGDFLAANPLGVAVHVGDLDNMNGRDYIFLDYLNEQIIPFDNSGCYKAELQISVYTKSFINRKILVDYIKGLSQFDIQFEGSEEGNYFVANMITQLFIK